MMNTALLAAEEASAGFTLDTSAVTTAFQNGLTTVANNMVSIGTMAVPFVIGVCGFFAIIKFGPKLVKMLKG